MTCEPAASIVHVQLPCRFALLLLPLFCACSSATTYAPRPYRFEAPSSVSQETQRIAQRMSGDATLRPALVDPNTGTILSVWRMNGVTSEVTLWPPGERHGWIVERYRVFVRPSGWASSVFVDVERRDCASRGFSWSELEVRGDCRPMTQMTAAQLQALDTTAASLSR